MTEGEALDLVLRQSIARRRAERELVAAMKGAQALGLSLRDIADYADLSHEGVRKMINGKGK